MISFASGNSNVPVLTWDAELILFHNILIPSLSLPPLISYEVSVVIDLITDLKLLPPISAVIEPSCENEMPESRIISTAEIKYFFIIFSFLMQFYNGTLLDQHPRHSGISG